MSQKVTSCAILLCFKRGVRKKRTAKLAYLAVLDRAGRSDRRPKEILVAPLCGESLFSYRPAFVLH